MDFNWGLIGPGRIAEGKTQSEVMPHERTLASQRIMDLVRRDAGLLNSSHRNERTGMPK